MALLTNKQALGLAAVTGLALFTLYTKRGAIAAAAADAVDITSETNLANRGFVTVVGGQENATNLLTPVFGTIDALNPFSADIRARGRAALGLGR